MTHRNPYLVVSFILDGFVCYGWVKRSDYSTRAQVIVTTRNHGTRYRDIRKLTIVSDGTLWQYQKYLMEV